MAWQEMEQIERVVSRRVNGKMIPTTWQDLQEIAAASGLKQSKATAKKLLRQMNNQQQWVNDIYRAEVHPIEAPMLSQGPNPLNVTELSITRHDKEAIYNSRHFQMIKNDIFGQEREALELYPAESRLVDSANTYWLYVLPEGITVPFGCRAGRFVQDAQDPRVKQEPLILR